MSTIIGRMVLLLLATTTGFTGACAQQVHLRELPKTTVEERMRAVPDNNAEREATLKRFFSAAGCTATMLTEAPVKFETVPNLVCTLKGSSDSVIMVGAHSDHVPMGTGAVDNWSGAAMLPSLMQSLASSPRKHTFVFIAFTAEEKGLVGSEDYAKHLAKDERAKIVAMINIDSVGLEGTKVWASRADKKLLGELMRVAKSMKLPVAFVNADQAGKTDSFSFDNYRIPTIAIHSITQPTFRVLHSPRDTMAEIRMDDYYDTYRLMAVYLAHLDNVLP